MRFEEAMDLLMTAQSAEEIDAKREEIAEWIPAVKAMFGYAQQNYTHPYDLWMHCLHTVVGLSKQVQDAMVYLAALLHDIGKQDCRVRGKKEEDPNMHYYGHPERSMEIVRDEVIPQLLAKGVKLSEDDQRRLLYYVEYHDDRVSLRMHHLRRHLRIPVSIQEFQNLMLLQVADALAHVQVPIVEKRVEICTELAGEYGKELYERIMNGE